MEDTFTIRDSRAKEMFRIDDVYLNGYARLCGIHATGVYMSLCRHAGKEQTAFPSKKLMGEELNISERSVYTALKTLEFWGIIAIENQGRKEDGSFRNLLYVLKDKAFWKKKPPSANGAVGRKQQPPSANDDTTRRHVVPNKVSHKKEAHIKDTASQENEISDDYLDGLSEKKFAFAEKVSELGYNPALVKPIRLEVERTFKIKFPNKDAQESHIKAMLISGYDGETQIAEFSRLLDDPFWAGKGVDMGIVRNNIGKAKKIKTVSTKYDKYA